MKKIYIAKYSRGSYDDFTTIDVFVSDNKEIVENWVLKFNTKLKYWKEYFSQFSHPWSVQILDEKYYDSINGDRFYEVLDTNKAFIKEIEVR